MAVSFVDATTAYEWNDTTPLSVSVPDVSNGNILLLAVCVFSDYGTPTITDHASWTYLCGRTSSYAAWKLYWRRASSEPASYNIAYSVNTGYDRFAKAVMSSWSGCSSGIPVIATSTAVYETWNSTLRAGAVDSINGAMLVAMALTGYGGVGVTYTEPSGMTEGIDTNDCSMAYVLQTASGSSGNKDFTCSASLDDKQAFLVALSPEVVPTFVAEWHGEDDDTTITATKPTGVGDGDLLICMLNNQNAVAYTGPTGWSQLVEFNEASTGSIWWKIADGEGSTWNWTHSGSTHTTVSVLAYRGVDQLSPIYLPSWAEYRTSDTTVKSWTIDTPQNNCRLLTLQSWNSAGGEVVTAPTGFTERVNHLHTSIQYTYIADKVQGAVGASGNADTVITTATTYKHGWLVALKPAALASFVDGTSALDTSSGYVDVAAPAGIKDRDILLAFCATNASGAFTWPSGFTELGTRTTASTRVLGVAWKRANAESGAYRLQGGGTVHMGVVVAFRGCATIGNPYEQWSNTAYTTSDTNIRAEQFTTEDESTLVHFAFCGDDKVVTKPSGFTLAENYYDTYDMCVSYLMGKAAGDTGDIDATIGTASSTEKHAFMIALKPNVPLTTFVAVENAYGDAGSVVVPALKGVQDGDYIFYAATTWNLTDITLPSGFTQIAAGQVYNDRKVEVGYKVASSESGTYTFTGNTYMAVVMVVYRGIDSMNAAISNTGYTTSNAILRAASFTLTEEATVLWIGFDLALGAPVLPVAFIAPPGDGLGDSNFYGGAADWGIVFGQATAPAAATGIQDGSCTSGQNKRAMMIGLFPTATLTLTAIQVDENIVLTWE